MKHEKTKKIIEKMEQSFFLKTEKEKKKHKDKEKIKIEKNKIKKK